MGWNYGYGYSMMGHGGFGVFDLVISVFWVVLLIVLIVGAIRWLRHGHLGRMHHRCGSGSDALDIVRERYAKGEIDRAEFEEKKKDLS